MPARVSRKDSGTFCGWETPVTNGERFARAVTSTIYQNLFRVILRVRWHDTLPYVAARSQNDRTCIWIKITNDFDELCDCTLRFGSHNKWFTNYFDSNKFISCHVTQYLHCFIMQCINRYHLWYISTMVYLLYNNCTR